MIDPGLPHRANIQTIGAYAECDRGVEGIDGGEGRTGQERYAEARQTFGPKLRQTRNVPVERG